MPSPDYTARRAAFRKLNESGCFVIPNPWDAGSARYLQHRGFKALATTSAGFAFSIGLADAAVPRDAMLRNIADIAAAVDLPVNADFESGYARDPEGVAASDASADASASRVLLTARAECYLVNHPDPLRESLRRLHAYAEAGADVLY